MVFLPYIRLCTEEWSGAMDDFPKFMKNPRNSIGAGSPSRGMDGWVFDGKDGSQMALWSCSTNGKAEEHVHDFDEWFVVLKGQFTLVTGDRRISLIAGQEHVIPKGTPHASEFVAGTRTIHGFAGCRVPRDADG
jgi:uncharacterized cupin superfamily protein